MSKVNREEFRAACGYYESDDDRKKMIDDVYDKKVAEAKNAENENEANANEGGETGKKTAESGENGGDASNTESGEPESEPQHTPEHGGKNEGSGTSKEDEEAAAKKIAESKAAEQEFVNQKNISEVQKNTVEHAHDNDYEHEF